MLTHQHISASLQYTASSYMEQNICKRLVKKATHYITSIRIYLHDLSHPRQYGIPTHYFMLRFHAVS